MVLRHFNLREQPFGVTPDPRFLYASATHREALAALLYGIESGLGFVSLIANPGMGKTTILFEALGRLGDTARTVFLFQSIQTPLDLFRALLIDLGEKNPQGSVVDLETRLNEILLEQSKTGKKLIVVLDEAQNLDFAVLEAVRMLSNFETPSRKLVQIVLCGQLQLGDWLDKPQLLQLRQRISIFASLDSLSTTEIANYIQHRLKVAGYESAKPLFTIGAIAMIARHSGGIPRNINNICFNALTIGCALGKRTIDAEIVREVIGDLRVRKVERSETFTITPATDERRNIPLPKREGRLGLRVAAFAAVFFVISVTVWVLALASSGDAGTSKTHRDATISTSPSSTNSNFQEPAPVAASPLTDAKIAEAVPAVTLKQTPVSTPAAVPAKAMPPTQVDDAKGSSPAPLSDGNKDTLTKRAPAGFVDTAGNKFSLVEAHRTESLIDLCTEQFGQCEPALLKRIFALNPLLADPNHVKQGNTIIMPEAATSPEVDRQKTGGG